MYMMLRVHNLSKKMTYIKLKVIGCSPHPIHEYFKVNSLLLTLDTDLKPFELSDSTNRVGM